MIIYFVSIEVTSIMAHMCGTIDYSFAVSFSNHEHFIHCLDFCGLYVLDVKDSIIGEERAIVFFDTTAFLVVMNQL